MIVVKISDGLGNQLFQYAYASMLKTKTRQKIYLDISDINRMAVRESEVGKLTKLCDMREFQLNNFEITLPIIDERRISKINRYKGKNVRNKFFDYCRELRLLPVVYLNELMCNENEFRFSRWQSYYVEGFFFDKKYFEKESDVLRQEYKLREKIVIPKELEKILADRNTVSLHIRRGDFLRVGRDMSDSDYYVRAMDYVKARVQAPFLLIFSDDMEWVRNNMKFDLEHMMISGQGFSDCEELTLMSMCRNNIMANSTFSYWGAWLNPNKEKIVISPRGWRQKIIPDTWVQL